MPPFSKRSTSVREQISAVRSSPPQLLRRSSSVSSKPAPPIEIGSTGSIFSLVDRDLSTTTKDSSRENYKNSVTEHIWHNRLWIIPNLRSLSVRHSNPQKPAAPETETDVQKLRTVAEHTHSQPKTSTWKKFLKKLKGGGGKRKFSDGSRQRSRSKLRSKSGAIANVVSNATSTDNSPTANVVKVCSPQPTSPIWERRNAPTIKELDFSHLHTARMKKEHARSIKNLQLTQVA